jgi:hypothetical protein
VVLFPTFGAVPPSGAAGEIIPGINFALRSFIRAVKQNAAPATTLKAAETITNK